MNKGFSLLEVMISMMIATILLTASLTIYHQISKTSHKLQTMTGHDTQVMILQNRLQTDLTGICPLWFSKEQYEQLKDYKTSPKEQSTSTEQPIAQSDDETKQNNFFYAENNNGILSFFTFVTVNAMQMYGTDNQRFVRVVYKLIPSETDTKKYTLLRKEFSNVSNQVDKNNFLAKDEFYPILSNISEFTIEYGFINQPKTQKQSKDKETSNKPLDTQWLPEWGIVRETTKTNEYKPAIPEIIKIKITFEDTPDHQYKYEIFCNTVIDPSNKLISLIQKHHKQKAKEALNKEAKAKNATNTPQQNPTTPKAGIPKQTGAGNA